MWTTEHKIFHTLRIASAMCLIGHGAFGIITKAVWCNYLAVIGIGEDAAYKLMPVIGSVDILMGISLLIYPIRAVALWLVFWGLATAAMRPLAGEPMAELLERAGNFGAPLALLVLCPPSKGLHSWFEKLRAPEGVSPAHLNRLILCLRLTAFLLLAGHGSLNLLEKKGLLTQYTALGFDDPHAVALAAGIFEIAAAVFILLKPLRPFIILVLIWKLGTELFYPQWVLFEWVERGGSYGTLLALWFALRKPGHTTISCSFLKGPYKSAVSKKLPPNSSDRWMVATASCSSATPYILPSSKPVIPRYSKST